MSESRPGPSEELNPDGVTVPRLAATVIILRGGADGLEVLLVRRNPEARFMGGTWVFPGGAVNAGDGEGPAALRTAGVREVHEETGIALGDADELVGFSRWVTPARVKIRYDTWFFLASMPEGQVPRIDEAEIVDARWFTPAAALAARNRDEIALVFPTIKHLEQLSPFATTRELLEYARGRTVEPVEPQIVGEGETARIVLPGEPGYDG